jgi:hypothetical protein
VKPLTAGSEIDSWCTSCRMDLNHRIVAMVGPTPKRVECLTCGGQHNYRAPRTNGAQPAKKSGTPRASREPRMTQRAKNELDRVHDWESRIAGQPVEAFARYSMNHTFSLNDLVLHRKFGEGYVFEVLEDGKVNIMFRDGPRLLAHGHVDHGA